MLPVPQTPEKHRLSRILQEILADLQDDSMTVHEFVHAFHQRGFGILLMLFVLPVAIPVPKPPGVATFLSIPIIIFCLQMVLGADSPYIPAFLRNKNLNPKFMRVAIGWLIPKVEKFGGIFKPRLLTISESLLARGVGAFGLLMSVAILIPFPGSDIVPSICLLLACLALVMRDGKAVLLFTSLGVAYCVMLAFFGIELVRYILNLF